MKIMNNSGLYLRAHFLRSTNAAVKLAEKTKDEKDIKFATNLLSVKNTALGKIVKLSLNPARNVAIYRTGWLKLLTEIICLV